jgi:hypothetical protein
MNKLLALLVLALGGLAVSAAPSSGAAPRGSCPANISRSDPWVLVEVGDPNQLPADRNGDSFICSAQFFVGRRLAAVIDTDNSVDDGFGAFPPDPCVNGFSAVSIGDPTLEPAWIRGIDENRDGILCVKPGSPGFVEPPDPDFVLDNPNVIR